MEGEKRKRDGCTEMLSLTSTKVQRKQYFVDVIFLSIAPCAGIRVVDAEHSLSTETKSVLEGLIKILILDTNVVYVLLVN